MNKLYKTTIKMELPFFETAAKDDKSITIAEICREHIKSHYIEIDRLLSKKLVEALGTENLKILRENINAELRERRKKNNGKHNNQ